MPEYRTPSFLKPRTYEEIPASIDALFNAYQKSRQQSFGEASQAFGLQSQLAGQGIDPSGYDPENPSAFFEPILQEAKAKKLKGRETQEAELAKTKAETTALGLKSTSEKDKERVDIENKLRTQLQGLSKPFVEVRDAYSRVEASTKDPSAAGDIALIFNYMKILDPGSTVREGEFATAQNSGSVPQRVLAQYNRILSGERLAPELRKDFLGQAKNLYKSQSNIQKMQENEYRKLAERMGARPENVVLQTGITPSGGQQGGGKYSDMSDDEIRRQLNAP